MLCVNYFSYDSDFPLSVKNVDEEQKLRTRTLFTRAMREVVLQNYKSGTKIMPVLS